MFVVRAWFNGVELGAFRVSDVQVCFRIWAQSLSGSQKAWALDVFTQESRFTPVNLLTSSRSSWALRLSGL